MIKLPILAHALVAQRLAQRLVLCIALSVALCGASFAQSPDGLNAASFRQGWQTAQGSYMTALDVQLQPGWKTYWRAPGDAGIPPQFDWSGSDNIASVRLHWPSPQVFDLNGMRSIGYHDALILPMEVTAQDPTRPVTVQLSVHMGICKDICLPATLTVTGKVSGAGTADPAIRAALDLRPMSADEAQLAHLSCTVAPIKDGLRLTAQLDLPRFGADAEAVVFETNDPSIWVSQADAQRAGGRLTAISDLVGPSGAPFALERQGLTVTVISGRSSVELKGCPAP